MGGKPRDPEYWRKWRESHPEYRAREKARMASRESKSHGDRAAQRQRATERRLRKNGDNGSTIDHPLLDEAAAIASRHVKPDRRSLIGDTLWEDAVSVAVVALVEGHPAVDDVVREFIRKERAWRIKAMPLLLE